MLISNGGVNRQRVFLPASDEGKAGVMCIAHLLLNRFIGDFQVDHLYEQLHMRAAQFKVRIRRRKPVKIRAAHGGKQSRIPLRGDNAVI
jgi:hypothetical protein